MSWFMYRLYDLEDKRSSCRTQRSAAILQLTGCMIWKTSVVPVVHSGQLQYCFLVQSRAHYGGQVLFLSQELMIRDRMAYTGLYSTMKVSCCENENHRSDVFAKYNFKLSDTFQLFSIYTIKVWSRGITKYDIIVIKILFLYLRVTLFLQEWSDFNYQILSVQISNNDTVGF